MESIHDHRSLGGTSPTECRLITNRKGLDDFLEHCDTTYKHLKEHVADYDRIRQAADNAWNQIATLPNAPLFGTELLISYSPYYSTDHDEKAHDFQLFIKFEWRKNQKDVYIDAAVSGYVEVGRANNDVKPDFDIAIEEADTNSFLPILESYIDYLWPQ